MKKFLTVLLFALAMAIALPATLTEAADVPGFHQFGGQYLTFTGREDTGNGFRVYGYDCDIDLDEDFAEQFMLTLVNNYNFQFIDSYVNDYRRGQAKLFERWIFEYTGSKNVSEFQHKNIQDRKNPYYCHLFVSRSKNWQSGITHFGIYVAYGLTYGED